MGKTKVRMKLKGILTWSVGEAGAICDLLPGTQWFASRGTLAGAHIADIFISGEVSLLLGRLVNTLGKL